MSPLAEDVRRIYASLIMDNQIDFHLKCLTLTDLDSTLLESAPSFSMVKNSARVVVRAEMLEKLHRIVLDNHRVKER